jgi:hypothetical protein
MDLRSDAHDTSSTCPPLARLPRQLTGPMADVLEDHLRRLRRLNSHPNRVCHYDHLLAAHLIGFWEPMVRSLRTLDSRTVAGDAMRQALGDVRLARSTLSDAMKQMPAEALLPLLEQLLECLPAGRSNDPQVQDLMALKKRIHAVDGSYFQIPADVLWALAHTRRNQHRARQVRLDMHLDVLRLVPVKAQVSGQDDGAEWKAFAKTLEPGVIYLADRGFVARGFLRQVIDQGSDFVVRLKANTALETLTCRLLSEKARAAGVILDQQVRLKTSRWAGEQVDEPLRLVRVRDGRTGQEVELLTTLCEVPADVIGQLYRQRWSIELFFRWLKCVVRVNGFYSQNANGITLQLYCMIIATLLSYLLTGQRPGVMVSMMMNLAATNQLSMDRMAEVLERDAREKELARLRRLRKQTA